MMKKTIVFFLLFFITQSVYAEFVCDDGSGYYAIYQINTYNCPAGYYLPANTLGCQACSTGFTCPGGTFTFNPDISQGLTINSIPNNTMNNACANNFPRRIDAIFTPNTHNCSAGYYLPANVDACTICPENNYCAGGTYTFNETTPQGITACASGLYAPVGMWESAQCGHILHVGNNVVYLRSVAKTTPSFNFKFGNEIFYANMTTAEVPMNAGTIRQLKASDGITTWSIYDDTVTVPE